MKVKQEGGSRRRQIQSKNDRISESEGDESNQSQDV